VTLSWYYLGSEQKYRKWKKSAFLSSVCFFDIFPNRSRLSTWEMTHLCVTLLRQSNTVFSLPNACVHMHTHNSHAPMHAHTHTCRVTPCISKLPNIPFLLSSSCPLYPPNILHAPRFLLSYPCPIPLLQKQCLSPGKCLWPNSSKQYLLN
jgi:hypothetical protein